jgi:CheY-like chemotaxis protein
LYRECSVSTPYVFVVDDDEVVRLNMAKTLSRLNCHVRAFDSGEAVVEFFARQPVQKDDPHVILLDYNMGGMNGVDTLRAVRQFSPIPAVIFTANKRLVDVQAVKQLGRCEVMLKTIDLNILGQIVSGAMAAKDI